MKDTIMPVRQAARTLGIPPATIRELERQGHIGFSRIQNYGRTIATLVDLDEIIPALKKSGVNAIKHVVSVAVPENLWRRIPDPKAPWIVNLLRERFREESGPGSETKPDKKGTRK